MSAPAEPARQYSDLAGTVVTPDEFLERYIAALMRKLEVSDYCDDSLCDRIERNLREFARKKSPPEAPPPASSTLLVTVDPEIDRLVESLAEELDESPTPPLEPPLRLVGEAEDLALGAAAAYLDWNVTKPFAEFRRWWIDAAERTETAWSSFASETVVPSGIPTTSGLTFSEAVLQVLKDAAGEPVSPERLTELVSELTARPANLGSLDSLARQLSYKHRELQRVGPRTWAWHGAEALAAS